MKTAGAGGILLVGVGILLLQLAYSGRGKAVWDALRGSGASGGSDAPAPADGDAKPSSARTPTGQTYIGGNMVRITYSDGTYEDVPAQTIGGGDGTLMPQTLSTIRIG